MSLERIDKYELIKSIAVGGMAEVFLARQTGVQGFEKVVVIKRILPHLASQQRFLHMFLDEARLAARFTHPNIVQIYDLGEDAGSYFIAMEYIHGMDLKSIVKRCAKDHLRIPIEHVVKIMSGVLEGLHYAHSQTDSNGQSLGVVHRDVSPQNIIVSFQGGVKLVDFGIAKARVHISTTIPGRVKGKHAYMSPEQCQGVDLDKRSDIFSSGIILFELATWTRLFKRRSNAETLRAIVEGEVRQPQAVNPEIDNELEAIILKALQLAPDDRYQTAQEMQIALEDYLVGHGSKSNSILLSRFISDLFKDKLAIMDEAIKQAQVSNLEGAMLASDDKRPELSALLDKFFEDSASGNVNKAAADNSNSLEARPAAPEFTPSEDYTPLKVADLKRRQLPRETGKPIPKAPPPKLPDGLDLLEDPAPSSNRARSRVQKVKKQQPLLAPKSKHESRLEESEPIGAEIAEEPFGGKIDLLDYEDDDVLIPRKRKGGGKSIWGFVLLAALMIGGVVLLFVVFKETSTTATAPKKGRILLKSVPADADVYLNNVQFQNRTPTEVDEIEPNQEYTLKLTFPDLPPWEKKFTITDTTQPLEFVAYLDRTAEFKAKMGGEPIVAGLEGQGYGTIRVTSTPAGAHLYLDGVSTEKNTPTTIKVAGDLDHAILVEKEGLRPGFERVRLKNGEEKTLQLVLEKTNEPFAGRIQVRFESEPEGAKVIVEEFPLNQRTPLPVKLLAGKSSLVQIEMKGYQTWERNIRPVPGVELTIYAKLKRK